MTLTQGIQGKSKLTMMKLRFESDLEFQLQAEEAVCELFRGQEVCQTDFTVIKDRTDPRDRLPIPENDLGTGNRLTLLDDEILANLKDIQIRDRLLPAASLEPVDFTVEMETGTGKTHVCLRTVFELNKRYGFTKFVIVVPSVAIKEEVYKSLQMTDSYFRALYSGAPFECFLYDSANFGQVRNFAASPQIQIMVVTVGAFNKKYVNNLYKGNEKTGASTPSARKWSCQSQTVSFDIPVRRIILEPRRGPGGWRRLCGPARHAAGRSADCSRSARGARGPCPKARLSAAPFG